MVTDQRIAALEARVLYLETVLEAERQVIAEAAKLLDFFAARDAIIDRMDRKLAHLAALLGEGLCPPETRLQ